MSKIYTTTIKEYDSEGELIRETTETIEDNTDVTPILSYPVYIPQPYYCSRPCWGTSTHGIHTHTTSGINSHNHTVSGGSINSSHNHTFSGVCSHNHSS